jgi:hypothetical protein
MESCGFRESRPFAEFDPPVSGVSAMCCIFCEEPVRSVILSLAAVGVVAVIRLVRTRMASHASGDAAQSSQDSEALAVPAFADHAP